MNTGMLHTHVRAGFLVIVVGILLLSLISLSWVGGPVGSVGASESDAETIDHVSSFTPGTDGIDGLAYLGGRVYTTEKRTDGAREIDPSDMSSVGFVSQGVQGPTDAEDGHFYTSADSSGVAKWNAEKNNLTLETVVTNVYEQRDDAVEYGASHVYIGTERSGGLGGRLHRLDASDLSDDGSWEPLSGIHGVAYNPDDGNVYATTGSTVHKINSTMTPTGSINVGDTLNGLEYGDGFLYAAHAGGVYKIDPSDMSQVDSTDTIGDQSDSSDRIEYGSDGYLYAESTNSSISVSMVDPSTLEVIGKIDDGEISGGIVEMNYGDGFLYITDGASVHKYDPSAAKSSPSGSSTTTPEPGFDQDFELITDWSKFNPQRSELYSFYLAHEDGTRKAIWAESRVGDVTILSADAEDFEQTFIDSDKWILEDSDEFNFDNIATHRLRDLTAYKAYVRGTDPDAVKSVAFQSDPNHGTIEIEIWGPRISLPPSTPTPTPTTPTTTTTTLTPVTTTSLPPPPGYVSDPSFNFGDTDGNGIIDDPPPMNHPDFEIPEPTDPGETDAEPPGSNTYLQTGVFEFGDGSCVGVRYYDPAEETTTFTYNFTANNTQYGGAVHFDDPIGYYEECLETQALNESAGSAADELTGPDGNITDGGFDFDIERGLDLPPLNGSIDLGEGGSSFAGGADLGGSTGIFGAPPGGSGDSGGSGGIPTAVLLAGAAGGAYLFRDQITNTVRRATERVRGR